MGSPPKNRTWMTGYSLTWVELLELHYKAVLGLPNYNKVGWGATDTGYECLHIYYLLEEKNNFLYIYGLVSISFNGPIC